MPAVNKLPTRRRALIIRSLVEGTGLRATARVADVSVNTVVKLLHDAGEACADYHDEYVRGIEGRRQIQCDEMWGFIYAKDKTLPFAKSPPPNAGSTWTYSAIDADAKLIISYLTVKDRSAETTWHFMDDLWDRLDERSQITTDGLSFYVEAVHRAFGEEVDFAQVVKPYKRGGSRLYNRPRSRMTEKWVVEGEPDMSKAGTSFVERHNLDQRMKNSRLTRLTNKFSKRFERHKAMQHLYFLHYNFCQIHGILRVTPAMEIGLAKTLHDSEWIVELIDAAAPPPKKPGPAPGTKYKPRKRRW